MSVATRAIRWFLLTAALCGCALRAQSAGSLDIYFIDVEGGQATLFVGPDHESMLIDTGWDDHGSRDAKRIVATAKAAGLSRLDLVLITHYHDDHVGGAPQLSALIPIDTFLDHGALFEHCPNCGPLFDSYQKLLAQGRSKRHSVVVGDTLPLRSLQVEVVSSNGSVLQRALPGGGKGNNACAKSEVRPEDMTENGHSVGVVIQFGRFRAIDLGDLTWDRERQLMCPVNLLGDASLLVVSHHGWEQSSSPAYVGGVHAEAAVMDNGAKKGGSLSVLRTFRQFPATALWQLHRSEEGGSENTAPERIANLEQDEAADRACSIKVSARQDGAFSVTNERNHVTVNYPAR